MDIGRAFKAVFEDPGWVGKLLLALLFEILVVTAPAVVGYFLQYIRNVAEGRDVPLPRWNEFGTYWVRGLLVILAGIVYAVVGLILFIIGIIPAMILFQGAVVEYAMTSRAGSLFSLRIVWRHIVEHSEFWIALLFWVASGIAVSIVRSPFAAVHSAAADALGGLIGAALGIYFALVVEHLYGQYARFAYGMAVPPSGAQPAGGGYAPPPPGGYNPPPPPPPGGYNPPPPPPPPGGGHPAPG